MKMYHALPWSIEIEEVEIIRKTKSTVWMKGAFGERRRSIEGYYQTFEEAKNHFIKEHTEKIQSLERV